MDSVVLRLCSGAEMVKRLKATSTPSFGPLSVESSTAGQCEPVDALESNPAAINLHFARSVRAFNVPRTTILTGALQGPSKLTCANKNVPFGINTLLGLGHAHASLKALHKA
ncbi:hypothetical protein LWI28_014732 [Acer negundo]|uniref:Uncharacterized protein n=1 Tax=Acer negundo TaxID=4023 RepID=A0AAD5IEX5_ACENE|nr:hypothetical protein LWI28_014732 [Acer negundo]